MIDFELEAASGFYPAGALNELESEEHALKWAGVEQGQMILSYVRSTTDPLYVERLLYQVSQYLARTASPYQAEAEAWPAHQIALDKELVPLEQIGACLHSVIAHKAALHKWKEMTLLPPASVLPLQVRDASRASTLLANHAVQIMREANIRYSVLDRTSRLPQLSPNFADSQQVSPQGDPDSKSTYFFREEWQRATDWVEKYFIFFADNWEVLNH